MVQWGVVKLVMNRRAHYAVHIISSLNGWGVLWEVKDYLVRCVNVNNSKRNSITAVMRGVCVVNYISL